MLENCAKGFTMRPTDHNRRIEFNGKIFPSMPKKHDDVKLGYVRKMIRALDIDQECARKYLPL
jgi:hypothetical protein